MVVYVRLHLLVCYLESYLQEAIWTAILLKFGHVDSSAIMSYLGELS
jgi:hypothetical protein